MRRVTFGYVKDVLKTTKYRIVKVDREAEVRQREGDLSIRFYVNETTLLITDNYGEVQLLIDREYMQDLLDRATDVME